MFYVPNSTTTPSFSTSRPAHTNIGACSRGNTNSSNDNARSYTVSSNSSYEPSYDPGPSNIQDQTETMIDVREATTDDDIISIITPPDQNLRDEEEQRQRLPSPHTTTPSQNIAITPPPRRPAVIIQQPPHIKRKKYVWLKAMLAISCLILIIIASILVVVVLTQNDGGGDSSSDQIPTQPSTSNNETSSSTIEPTTSISTTKPSSSTFEPTTTTTTSTLVPTTTTTDSEGTSLQTGWVSMGAPIPGEATNAQSGKAVAISEDATVLAIGEPGLDQVRVFDLYKTNSSDDDDVYDSSPTFRWVPRENSNPIRGPIYSNFGASIALSNDGRTIAIGGPTWDKGVGIVKLYYWTLPQQIWIELHETTGIVSSNIKQNYGSDVSLSSSGKTLAIYVPYPNPSHIELWTSSTGELGSNHPWEGWNLLSKYTMSTTTASSGTNSDTTLDPGRVSLAADGIHFLASNGLDSAHIVKVNLLYDDIDINEYLGEEVSGSFAIVSKNGQALATANPITWDDYKEGVFDPMLTIMYKRETERSWTPYVNGRFTGFPVALSFDGSVVAVATPSMLRCYQNRDNVWTELGEGIYIENEELADIKFASTVSIGDEGIVVVIGNPTSNGPEGSQQRGSTFVYTFKDPSGLSLPTLPPTTPTDTDCHPGTLPLRFFLTTDLKPEDISWTINSHCFGTIMKSEDDPNFPYTSGLTLHERSGSGQEVCADPTDCLTMRLEVKGRNGLCCEFGEGGYTVYLGNQIITSEKDDYPKDGVYTHLFGDCTMICPETPEVLPKPPTNPPTDPTNPPSNPPTDPINPPSNPPTDPPVPLNSSWLKFGNTLEGRNPGDEFGRSISLSSNGYRLAVGAKYYDGNGRDSGEVEVFEYSGNNWHQLGNSIFGDREYIKFGRAVSLSRDGTTFGSFQACINDDDTTKLENGYQMMCNAASIGLRVYRYDPSIGLWYKLGNDIYQHDSADSAPFSGTNVFLAGDSGEIAAVGASRANGDAFRDGEVRIFQYNHETKIWDQLGQDILGEEAYDGLGFSVSMDRFGKKLAVGAYQYSFDDSSDPRPGYALVYRWNHVREAWERLGQRLNGEGAGDHFGAKVTLSADGRVLAVSADLNDHSGTGSGRVRVYAYDEEHNLWLHRGQDIEGEFEGDNAGLGVSMSYTGSIISVGSHNNDAQGTNAGHVRVFQYSTSRDLWEKIAQTVEGPREWDGWGFSVSLSDSGQVMAVGGYPKREGQKGKVRTYRLDDQQPPPPPPPPPPPEDAHWVPMGYTLEGEYSGDEFGRSVSLSSNGLRLAVGAKYNDATGENSGHIRVFEYSGNHWHQLGQDIDGAQENMQFGKAISLSSDGSTVAGYQACVRDDNTYVMEDGSLQYCGRHNSLFVYRYSSGYWHKLGNEIEPDSGDDNAFSSTNVFLAGASGDIAALGISRADNYVSGQYLQHCGEVQIRRYSYSEYTWEAMGQTIVGEEEHDGLGFSVSMNRGGDRLAIGAYQYSYDDSNDPRPGYALAYMWNNSKEIWERLGQRINGEAPADHCGSKVTLSGDGQVLAVSSDLNDQNGNGAGKVRVYIYNQNRNQWDRRGQDIMGEFEGDNAGLGVSLSYTGDLIAVGSHNNDAQGTNAGHVRVFRYSSLRDQWDKEAQTIEGSQEWDGYGFSVALSDNGRIMAVGGYPKKAGKNGKVQIYRLDDQPRHPRTFVWVTTDGDRRSLLKMTTDGEIIFDISYGQGGPVSVDPADGSAWVPNLDNNEAVKFDSTGKKVLQVGNLRYGISAIDPNDGSLWIALPNEGVLVKLDSGGNELFRTYTDATIGICSPGAMMVDPRNGLLWVANRVSYQDPDSNSIVRCSADGRHWRRFGTGTNGFFSNAPGQLVVDPNDGSVWYVDAFGSSGVRKLSSSGNLQLQVGGFSDRPLALAIDPQDSSLWVCSSGSLVKIDKNGNSLVRLSFGDFGAGSPRSVSVHPTDGTVWVGLDNGEMVRLTTNGEEISRIRLKEPRFAWVIQTVTVG